MCSTVGAAQKKDKTDRGLKAGDFLSDELTNAFKRRVRLWPIASFRCAAKFGRYWGHSGHSETPPPEIILANPIYMSRHRFIV